MAEYTNPNLDNGREHRVGADLYDWNYNNTYDIDNVVRDIKTFIDQLYTHSLYSQGVLCDVSRICGSMADFRRDVTTNDELGLPYQSYTLEIPMRNVHCFNTLKLKRANPRIYTIYDSCAMTDLFERRLLMFIDGEFFPGIKFYADSNRFVLVIDATYESGIITQKNIAKLIENGADWSILMLPFSASRKGRGVTNTLANFFLGIPFDNLKSVSNVNYVDRNMWLLSVNTDSNNPCYPSKSDPDHNTSLTKSIITTVGEYMHFMFHVNYFSIPNNFKNLFGTNISVDAIAIPNIAGEVNLGSTRAFQISFNEENKNPIPPQNIICWSLDETTGTVKYIHNAVIKLFYPNVYKIENIPKSVCLYITWLYNTSDTTEFTNPLDQYMEFNSAYSTEIINDMLPVTVKGYIPMVNTYKETNYLDYFVQATRRNEFTYKFGYLKELIRDDTRRLEKIYTDMVTNTAYKWHSSPRYYIDMSTWGNYATRRRIDNTKEIFTLGKAVFPVECIYFVIDHEDEREYPVSVWVDGVKVTQLYMFTESYHSIVYIPIKYITPTSIIEFEILKVRSSESTEVIMEFPKIHNSVQLPRRFVDFSPQNIMIAIQKEHASESDDETTVIGTQTSSTNMFTGNLGVKKIYDGLIIHYYLPYDGTLEEASLNLTLTGGDETGPIPVYHYSGVPFTNQIGLGNYLNMHYSSSNNRWIINPENVSSFKYEYKVANEYEMYWLIYGINKYIDGVPENYSRTPNDTSTDIVDITSQDMTLATDDTGNTVIKTSGGTQWRGGSFDYLMERGFENYITVPSEEYPDDYRDYISLIDLGYYGEERRRFFEYLPNGEDDPPIYITPITDYFASNTVKIKNTDIYWTKTFSISKNNRIFKITDYVDEPTPARWRIYLNGVLLDPWKDYHVDKTLATEFYLGDTLTFAILKDFEGESAQIFFEYLPYKYLLLYNITDPTSNTIQLRNDQIRRPFSMVYYDVYVDGIKLLPKDVEKVTVSKIKINKDLKGKRVSFYERMHDPDIYDNEVMIQKSLSDKIAEEDGAFRKYLME